MSKKITISLIIIIWILLQIYTGFFGTTYTWPFIRYAMYAPKQNIGDKITELRLYGHTVSGKVIQVTPEDLGLLYWGFRKQGWSELLNPQTCGSYTSQLFSIYNQRQEDASQKIRDLQVVLESRLITRNGYSDLIREVIFTYAPKQ